MRHWAIFYDDGRVCESGDYEERVVPRQGVIAIAQRDFDHYRVLDRHDTYCWQDGFWVPHDRFGCERYLDDTPNPIRLVGYCVSNENYATLHQRAIDWKQRMERR